jgi:uncharacterized protein with FMN-binding domain
VAVVEAAEPEAHVPAEKSAPDAPAAVVATAPPAAAPAARVTPEAKAATESATAAAPVTVSEPEPELFARAGSQTTSGGNWRDGTYTGWGTSRHGDIKAQVVIRNGRIVESSIASCETAYPCDVISMIVHQPVDRQNPDVDRVSRATESADAYYFGLVDALADAAVARDVSDF